MNYARRTDANHSAVAKCLRQLGWRWTDTSHIPQFFDGIAIRGGCVRFCEVKDGSKPPSERRLTEAQKRLHADFTAAGAVVVILQSVRDAEAME